MTKEKILKRQNKWRLKNSYKVHLQRKRYYEKHKERLLKKHKEWAKNNPEKIREYSRQAQKRNRLRVLEHYGKKCNCCKESRIQFLVIDHINNDGHIHRKKIGRGSTATCAWLIKNNYPKGFQVLCYNCNMAKALYGKCPHGYLDNRK